MRRERRLRQSTVSFTHRHVVRLISLALVCVASIVLLGSDHIARLRELRRGQALFGEHEIVQTALAPSPFAELGAGVFLANGRPGEEDVPDAAPDQAAPPGDGPPLVDPERLGRILDKTSSLPPGPYYYLVDLANKTPAAELRKHAAPEAEITFAHLMREPIRYRGQLVTLKGHLRTLKRFEASENEKLNSSGVKVLYQGDLFTNAAHPNPYVVIMPSVPDGLPLGLNISEDVTFTGFFFKLWRYKAADDLDRAAPVLIGQLMSWTPAPSPEAGRDEATYWTLVALLAVLASGVVAWIFIRLFRRTQHSEASVEPESGEVKADLARLEEGGLPDAEGDIPDAAGELSDAAGELRDAADAPPDAPDQSP
jgi:hypothetical protein